MPGGAWITGVSFRRDEEEPRAGEVTFQSVEVILSTTDRTVSSVSPVFAENLGPDAGTVYSQGAVHWTLRSEPGRANPFDAVIQFPRPFLYDPRNGSLLIDVRLMDADSFIALDRDGPNVVPPSVAFYVRGMRGDPPGNLDLSSGYLNGGSYVTQISFIAIPEPSAQGLFALGAAAIVLCLRRSPRGPTSQIEGEPYRRIS